MSMEEKRIYAVIAGSIQVPMIYYSHEPPLRTVVQPMGRQIAQACHVVSKLRFTDKPSEFVEPLEFYPRTTIILQARDSAEMLHVYTLLRRKHLNPVFFSDNNPEYGPGDWPTAIAVYGLPKQVQGILDYLPLWGSK